MPRMSFTKWWRTYQPQSHQMRTRSFNHCLYDPLDEDEKLRAFSAYESNPRTVWTFMEHEGRLYIVAGWGLMNRLGYFVCARQFENEMDAPEIPLGRA